MRRVSTLVFFALIFAVALPLALLCEEGGPVTPPGAKGGVMVLVPEGDFYMGCSKYDGHCDSDERPYHKVYLDAYYIDVYEVTNSQYAECVKEGGCAEARTYIDFDAPDQPVVGVSWRDSKRYCEWAGKRLPTEAEWEKAARGTSGRVYPWGNSACGCDCAVQEAGQIPGCGTDATLPVGSAKNGASPYGAYDMSGNVWEWVADWYGAKYYSKSPDKNPSGPEEGERKVRRGGGFANIKNYLRASDRSPAEPRVVSNSTGFRCALPAGKDEAPPKEKQD